MIDLPTVEISICQYDGNGNTTAKHNVTALIDSGTSQSIIARKALSHSALKETELTTPRTVVNALNMESQPVIFRKLMGNIRFLSSKKEVPECSFFILESEMNYDVILGMDVLTDQTLEFSPHGVIINKLDIGPDFKYIENDSQQNAEALSPPETEPEVEPETKPEVHGNPNPKPEVKPEPEPEVNQNTGSCQKGYPVTFQTIPNHEKTSKMSSKQQEAIYAVEDCIIQPLSESYVKCEYDGKRKGEILVMPDEELSKVKATVEPRFSTTRNLIKVKNGSRMNVLIINENAVLARIAPKTADTLSKNELAVISNFLLSKSEVSEENQKLLETEVSQWRSRRQKLLKSINLDDELRKKVETTPTNHKEELYKLLKEFHSIFARSQNDAGLNAQYMVNLDIRPGENGDPSFIKPYKIGNPETQKKLEKKINELITAGILEETSSPWNSPALTVSKKGTKEEVRLVTNFKEVNKRLLLGSYPIPSIRELNARISEKIAQLKYRYPQEKIFFSQLDLKNAFFILSLTKESRPMTAFIINNRQVRYTRLSMGLSVSPSNFQQFMKQAYLNTEFDTDEWFLLNYMDDWAVVSTESSHIRCIRKFFEISEKRQVLLSLRKCKFFKTNISFLGLKIDREGFHAEKSRTDALLSLPYPTSRKEAQRFMGSYNFFTRLIPKLSLLLSPLAQAIGEKTFVLNENCKTGIDKLKQLIKNHGIGTAHLDYGTNDNETVFLACDTSLIGSGFALGNAKIEGEEITILSVAHYGSKKLDKMAQLLSSRSRELIGLATALETFSDLLYESMKFICLVDHKSLESVGQEKSLGKTSSHTRTRAALARVLNYPNMRIFYAPANTPIVEVCDGLSRNKTFRIEEMDGAELDPKMVLPIEINSLETTQITVENLIKEQRVDQNLGPIIENLLKLKEPRDGPYRLVNGILMKEVRNGNATLTVIPEKLAQLIVSTIHIQNVHSGEKRLRDAIRRSNFLIPSITKRIKQTVRRCIFCQMNHQTKFHRPDDINYRIQPAVRPWMRLSVDLMDISVSNQACYLLTFVDKFSRFVDAEIVRRKNAEAIVPAMVLLITRNGAEFEANIASDRGLEFLSSALKEAYRRLKVLGHQQSSYNSRANPCERTHKELRRLLRTLRPTSRDYVQKTLLAVNFYNGLPQAALDMKSPREILTGIPPRAYLNYLNPLDSTNLDENVEVADEEDSDRPVCIWADYLDNLHMEHGLRELDRYNTADQPESVFNVGDLCLVLDPIITLSKTNKPDAKGPFMVISKNRNTLKLRHIISHHEILRNGRFCRPMKLDDEDRKALIQHEEATRLAHKIEVPQLISLARPEINIFDKAQETTDEPQERYNLRERK